jgi:hypothetical protein
VGETINWNLAKHDITSLEESLAAVLLEEWGGPRSPLALKYIHETIIPDLVSCFCQNADLLANSTFAEIVQWKLTNQFAHPSAVVEDLTRDLLLPAQKIIKRSQITEPKEPWRRIFRLWVSDESLPNIAARFGYPLDYLDLLVLRYKKLKNFVANTSVSLLECQQNSEFRDFGFEQLTFLYRFQAGLSGETFFKERLILEQIVWELGMPFHVRDLIILLEIIHAHEGELDEDSLITALSDQRGNLIPCAIDGLISLHYIKKNKTGKLTLTEKSAQTIAGFLLPKLGGQLKRSLAIGDFESAQGIMLKQNQEVLMRLIDWSWRELNQDQAFKVLNNIYQKVSRRIDIRLLKAFANLPVAFELLIRCLGDNDSLIRAGACEALGQIKNKAAVFSLIQLLRDPVVGVREMTVKALCEIGTAATAKELLKVAEDYGESINVREQARNAIRKIGSRNREDISHEK